MSEGGSGAGAPPLTLPRRYRIEGAPLGSGGFGSVHRGWDDERGIPVAIKVPFRSAQADVASEALVELRAAAGLRHRGFVQVLDANLSVEGQPYLVLELADGGSWERVVAGPPRPWDQIRQEVDLLLDALGYAHARGLVHRDIKPDNVLVFDQDRANGALRIGDFGLAKLLERGRYGNSRLSSGTLLYMAPEAFTGEVGSVHPGADLYAIGVMLYRLLCGRPPWPATDLSLVMAKLHQGVPRVEPRDGVQCPSWVPDVVARLLDPDPASRFSLAADVRDALDHAPVIRRRVPQEQSEQSGAQAPAMTLPTLPPRDAAPPNHPATDAIALVREPTFVDRDAARATMWAATRQATAGPTAVVVTGRAGVGRSRLVEWLVRHLEQQGLAVPLRIRVDISSAPIEAAADALRHHLRLLEPSTCREQVGAWLRSRGAEDRDALAALVNWLGPARGGDQSLASAHQRAAQRLGALDAVLRVEAGRGLALIYIDEGEGGDDSAAELSASVLRQAAARPFPLLLIHERRAGATPPPALVDAVHIALDPLAEADVHTLIGDLAPPALAAGLLRTRMRGEPGHVVEAVRSRLHSDLLSTAQVPPVVRGAGGDQNPSPHSFDETMAVTPQDLAASRIERWINDDERRLCWLQVLAALPRPVPEAVAVGAFRALTEERAPVADSLLVGIVVRVDDGALTFGSSALADAVQALPPDVDGRAAVGVFLVGERSLPDPLRRHGAQLLAEAERWSDAITALSPLAERALDEDAVLAARLWTDLCRWAEHLPLDDARRWSVRLGLARAARQQGDLTTAEAQLGSVPPEDAAYQAQWFELRAGLHLLRADPPAAAADATTADAGFTKLGDGRGRARALSLRADALARAGDRQGALLVFDQALQQARSAEARRETLWILGVRGRTRRALGDRAAAREDLDAALQLARDAQVAAVEGSTLRELGNLALVEGQLDVAERCFTESTKKLDAAGLRAEAAVTRISSGELARARGDLVAARNHYAAALAVCRAFRQRSEALVATLNLAITELQRGQVSAASRRLAEIDQDLPRGTTHGLRPHIEALRVALDCEEGRWPEADGGLQDLRGTVPAPDPDLLLLVERAGTTAAVRGEYALALDAHDEALRLADALGDEGAIARLRERMAGWG